MACYPNRLNLGFFTALPEVYELSDMATSATLDKAELETLVRETAEISKSNHRVLMGEPEYKRKGLVEIVDFHQRIIIWGGGCFATASACWEVFKYLHPH